MVQQLDASEADGPKKSTPTLPLGAWAHSHRSWTGIGRLLHPHSSTPACLALPTLTQAPWHAQRGCSPWDQGRQGRGTPQLPRLLRAIEGMAIIMRATSCMGGAGRAKNGGGGQALAKLHGASLLLRQRCWDLGGVRE